MISYKDSGFKRPVHQYYLADLLASKSDKVKGVGPAVDSVTLFPFNRSRRLRAQIIAYPVYIRNFLHNPIRNLHKHLPIHLFDCGAHGVHCIYRPDNNRIFKTSRMVLYPYRFKVRHRRKILPYFPVEPGYSKLFPQNGIRFAYRLRNTISLGSPNSSPQARTSSLNK